MSRDGNGIFMNGQVDHNPKHQTFQNLTGFGYNQSSIILCKNASWQWRGLIPSSIINPAFNSGHLKFNHFQLCLFAIFQIFFLVALFGMYHALVFLPVLLSICSSFLTPHSNPESSSTSSTSMPSLSSSSSTSSNDLQLQLKQNQGIDNVTFINDSHQTPNAPSVPSIPGTYVCNYLLNRMGIYKYDLDSK